MSQLQQGQQQQQQQQQQQNMDQICISYNNNTNYFCLREGINIDHFENLLKAIFSIDGNILGLKSLKTGVIYDIGEFCNQNYFQLSNESFQIIAQNPSLGSPLNSNPTRFSSQNHRSHSNLSSSLPKQIKINSKSISRNKSNDLSAHNNNTNNNNNRPHRYSIKSASKYSSDEACQYYIEDFEVFMSLPGKENHDYLYCFFLFDDTQTMKQYGPSICKSYQFYFPSIDFFYSLYPSKRSRSPFQPSDTVMFFSLYQGGNIIIERELALSLDASESIIKAMSQYIQKHDLYYSKSDKRVYNFNEDNTYTENSFQMINYLGSDSNFQKRDGSFSDIPSHDNVFEIIECFSRGQIRRQFNDEEFKELLKVVRKNNKKINNIYLQFKVSNDYDELITSIRNTMNFQNNAQSILTNNNNLNGNTVSNVQKIQKKKNDSQLFLQQNNNILNHLSSSSQNQRNIVTSSSSKTNNTKSSQKKKLVPDEMSFDVSSKEKQQSLTNVKGMRQYLKRENRKERLGQENILGNKEIGYIIYGIKSNDSELQELLNNLSTFSKPRTVITILKAYASQQLHQILSSKFNPKQLDFIHNSDLDTDSPIHAAFLNWMVLGNLNDLINILDENVKNKRKYSILKKKGGKVLIDEQALEQQKIEEQFDYSPSQIAQEPHFEMNGSIISSHTQQVFLNTNNNNNNNNNNFIEDINGNTNNNNYNNNTNYSNNIVNNNKIMNENKEPGTPVYEFKYSQFASRQKKNRKPTFTLNQRLTQDINEALEENITKDLDQLAIQKQLESYFSTLETDKDASYYKLYTQLQNENYVDENIMKDLEEVYEYNYVPFYLVLESYRRGDHVSDELQEAIVQYRDLKSQIRHLLCYESPIFQEKLIKYKGFLTNIAYLYLQDYQLGERTYRILNNLFLRQEMNTISAYELYCIDLNIDEFAENLKLIEQIHFFKHTIDYQEIELNNDDEDMDQINLILFLIKSMDIESQNILAIEKVIKYGDRALLNIFNTFKQKKNADMSLLIKQLMSFAEQRAQEVEEIEENIKNQKCREDKEKNINLQIDTLYTMSSLLKEVKHFKIIEDLLKEQHKLTQSAFEVYDFTKDKQDFLENITKIYQWNYIKSLKDIIKKYLFDQKQSKQQITFMMNLVKDNNPHIMSAWELYLKDKDWSDFMDTITIILKQQYKK